MVMVRSRVWRDDARCKGAPLEIFFDPVKGTQRRAVRLYCDNCPVVDECLLDAARFENKVTHIEGVRGGLLGFERKRLYKGDGKERLISRLEAHLGVD